MRAALVGVPVVPLPLANRKYVLGETTRVPDVSGLSISDARTIMKANGFEVVTSDHFVNSLFPAGTVAYTDPRGGSSVPQGTTIVLRLSNGIPPPPPRPSPSPSPSNQPSSTPSSQPSTSASPTPTRSKHGPHGH